MLNLFITDQKQFSIIIFYEVNTQMLSAYILDNTGEALGEVDLLKVKDYSIDVVNELEEYFEHYLTDLQIVYRKMGLKGLKEAMQQTAKMFAISKDTK